MFHLVDAGEPCEDLALCLLVELTSRIHMLTCVILLTLTVVSEHACLRRRSMRSIGQGWSPAGAQTCTCAIGSLHMVADCEYD